MTTDHRHYKVAPEKKLEPYIVTAEMQALIDDHDAITTLEERTFFCDLLALLPPELMIAKAKKLAIMVHNFANERFEAGYENAQDTYNEWHKPLGR